MPSASIASDVVEVVAREVAIRIRAAHDRVELVGAPIVAARTRPRAAARGCRAAPSGCAARRSRRLRIARTSAAHSSSSSRVVAKKRPSGFAPTQWPERPMRCNATAIERGEPSCTTRSTEPMSMPSSSDAVATTARSSPVLQPVLGVEAASRARGCRDAAGRRLRPAARRARTRRARSCGACRRRPASCGASRISSATRS